MLQRIPNIAAYHAHVYFDADCIERARTLCQQAAQRFSGVAMGRVHEKTVGPHPRWSCQLAFPAAVFDDLVAWVDHHRDGLTVLVHGVSDDDLADHTKHARWLGEPVALRLEVFGAGADKAQ